MTAAAPTPAEWRLADALVAVVDMAGRVLGATPGSRYQADKTESLLRKVEMLQAACQVAQQQPVRPAVVDALIAQQAHHYPIGRALWPAGGAIVQPEAASTLDDRFGGSE